MPGTVELARWTNPVGSCRSGVISEHKDDRALDWSMNAASTADRATVRALLTLLRPPDPDALARRAGVM